MAFCLTGNMALSTRIANDLLQMSKNSVCSIEAPTGTGKTTSVAQALLSHKDIFGKTLFVQPTSTACVKLSERISKDGFVLLHASAAIDRLLFHKKLCFDTVVIDEAHVLSKEYHMLFYILKAFCRHRDARIILISATMPTQQLQEFFDPIHSFQYTIDPLYPVKVVYEEDKVMRYPGHVSKEIIMKRCIQRVHDAYTNGHKKMMIFMATHSDCDAMMDSLQAWSQEKTMPLLILHGGLEPEEKSKVYKAWEEKDSFVLACTNIIESSVTIPQLDVVIDSGIECRPYLNMFELAYADRRSLVQRAGRVGRTKPGVVYRIMTEDEFTHHILDCIPVEHDMNTMVVKIMNRSLNPFDFLPGDIVDETFDVLDRFGVLANSGKPTPETRFIEKSGLMIRNALLAYTLGGVKEKTLSSFICFLLCIIDFYDAKFPRWIYFPKNVNRVVLVKKIRDVFDFEGDMLLSIAKMLLTVFAEKKRWRDTAKKYSLNQRVLRDFFSHTRHIFSRMMPSVHIEDVFKMSLDDHGIVCFSDDLIRDTRMFFFSNRYMDMPLVTSKPFFASSPYFMNYAHFYSSVVGRHPSEQQMIVPISHRHSDDIVLWINTPWNLCEHYTLLLSRSIQLFKEREEKRQWQELFRSTVVDEIDNEVAFRPHMYKMLEAQTHFHLCAQNTF